MRRTAAMSLMVFGAYVIAFAIFVFAASGLQQAHDQDALESTFRTNLTKGSAPVGGEIAPGTPVAQLRIPAISLSQIVVEGSSSAELQSGPGHLRAAPLPGQAGNVVLAGHRTAFGGPFRHIGELHKGDQVLFRTGQGESTYVVNEVRTASATDPTVFTATDNRVTLVTSDPAFRSSRRLTVVARLSGDALPAPGGRLRGVPTDEQGLQGTTAHTAELALWLQLLVVASVGTVLLYRRLSGRTAYLLTTPVLLALGWLFFGNLALLLPSTL